MTTAQTGSMTTGRLFSAPVVILWVFLSLFFSECIHILGNSVGLLDIIPSFFGVFIVPVLSGVVFAWLVLRFVYKKSFGESGCQWIDPSRRDGMVSQVVGFGLFLIGIQCAVWFLVYRLPHGAELSLSNPLYALIEQGFNSVDVANIVYMCLLVGLIKEPFARGLVQNTLQHRYTGTVQLGKWTVQHSTIWAAILLTVWNSAFNMYLFQALLISEMPLWVCLFGALSLGCVTSFSLAYVYEKTQAMAATVILHNIIEGSKILVWFAVAAAMA
jgi:hypothetical protein